MPTARDFFLKTYGTYVTSLHIIVIDINIYQWNTLQLARQESMEPQKMNIYTSPRYIYIYINTHINIPPKNNGGIDFKTSTVTSDQLQGLTMIAHP